VPRFTGEPQHDLAVDEVLGAAERKKANLHFLCVRVGPTPTPAIPRVAGRWAGASAVHPVDSHGSDGQG
jgi:hypothetical protein